MPLCPAPGAWGPPFLISPLVWRGLDSHTAWRTHAVNAPPPTAWVATWQPSPLLHASCWPTPSTFPSHPLPNPMAHPTPFPPPTPPPPLLRFPFPPPGRPLPTEPTSTVPSMCLAGVVPDPQQDAGGGAGGGGGTVINLDLSAAQVGWVGRLGGLKMDVVIVDVGVHAPVYHRGMGGRAGGRAAGVACTQWCMGREAEERTAPSTSVLGISTSSGACMPPPRGRHHDLPFPPTCDTLGPTWRIAAGAGRRGRSRLHGMARVPQR